MRESIGQQLRALYQRVVDEPLDRAMDRALADLGAHAFDPARPIRSAADAGDTADPVAVDELERRVAAAGE